MKITCRHCGANKVTPAGLCGKCMRFGSPIMEAAAKAAGVVDTWSKSKREYARRVTELNQSTDIEIDASISKADADMSELGHLRRENALLRSAARQIKDGYGPNHGSKYCFDVAAAVLVDR